MSGILKSLIAGFSVSQVLSYMSQALPGASSKIKKAQNAGHTAEQILSFLSQGMGSKSSPGMTESEILSAQKSSKEKFGKGLLSTAASATGAAAALPMLGQAVSELPGMIQKGVGLAKGLVSNPVEQASQSTSPQQIAQAAPAMAQQEMPQPEGLDSEGIINEMELGDMIQNLSGKNPPENVAALAEKVLSSGQQKWLKSNTNQKFSDIVKDYISKRSPIGKTAELPDGSMGEVVSEKNGISKVMTNDGKERHQKTDKLIQEPPDLENAFNTLIAAIPEDERSAAISFAGYDPESKTLVLDFHTGDKYLYPGATQEQADKIINKISTAKTTGEHPIHAWNAGEKSRGAGVYQVLKELEKEFGKNYVKIEAKGSYDWQRVLRPYYTGKAQREKQRALGGESSKRRKKSPPEV